jgi:cell division septation protein DedD
MSAEHEDFREDKEMEDDDARSIFAAGWFRAVLVLTVLAIVVVVALPHVLNWFDPASPPSKGLARPSPNAESSAPPSAPVASPVQSLVAPAPAPAAPQLPTALPAEEVHRTLAPATGMPRARSAAPAKPLASTQVAKASETSARPDRSVIAPPKVTDGAGGYWVQVGSFKDAKNADGLAWKLRDQGFPVQVTRVTRNRLGAGVGGVAAGTYHLVRAGGFADRSAAVAARASLSAKGYSGFLTEGVPK